MATNKPLTESQRSELYTQASRKFISASSWRELLSLAEEFHALDTYKDSSQMYLKCIKGASAQAYREITTSLEHRSDITAQEYREAARIMGIIQDYADAREIMRVYTVKANALTYEEAISLISNSEATTDDWSRAVSLLRSIKGFKDTRELLDHYERYYFDRVYREALALMENGHVYTEFQEAAELFERIPSYSDASSQATICRKKAAQLSPKLKKEKTKKTVSQDDTVAVKIKKPPSSNEGHADRVTSMPEKSKRHKDETVSGFIEVWSSLDKRRMVTCILWWMGFALSMAVSILVSTAKSEWIIANANTIRFITVLTAVVTAVMGTRSFLRMLTASMRKKLSASAVALFKKLVSPLVKVVNKLLLSIGIDINRRHHLGGKDERTFVFEDTQHVKKKKKKLKNELHWTEQPNNAARVRFIFIDYMIHRIRKGYFMRHSMTVAEIGQEIAIENDEKLLFDIYQKARYAAGGGTEEITDIMVLDLKKINDRKN